MTRPAGKVPTWATTANYPSGPKVGTPTRVDPGSAKAAVGWAPGERPPAQWENFRSGQVGDFLAYLDAYDVKNWRRVPSIAAIMSDIASNDAGGILYSVGYFNSFGTDIPQIAWSLDDGETWTFDASVAVFTRAELITYNTSESKYLVTMQGQAQYVTGNLGTHTAHNIAGAGLWAARFTSVGATTLLGGIIGGNAAVWKADSSGFTALTLATPTSDKIALISAGGPRYLAWDLHGNQWDTTSLASGWTFRGVVAADAPIALEYNATTGVYTSMHQQSLGTDVYTSTDGVTWAFKNTLTGYFSTNAPPTNRALTTRGALWCSLLAIGGTALAPAAPYSLVYSSDDWATAVGIPIPIGPASGTPYGARLRSAGGRLWALCHGGSVITSGTDIAGSMR